MLQIKKLYRNDYAGEEITTELTHTGSQWHAIKEWLPNAITNNNISTQAVIIGGSVHRGDFDLNLIKNHKGGLFGSRRLQSYGTNDLYKTFEPDFLVSIGRENVKEISKSGYCRDHIVYTNSKNILDYPGKFYLAPQDPPWNSGAIATYLACFDGHTKVYLLGFETEDHSAFWIQTMAQIFNLYNDVDFVFVMPTKDGYIPDAWKSCVNVRSIGHYDFALEADL
jgi:hypothetical protein